MTRTRIETLSFKCIVYLLFTFYLVLLFTVCQGVLKMNLKQDNLISVKISVKNNFDLC